tara:strand:- start:8968 stop:9522 length:555 start_codon:yes stop_codon:yes gene_type:complete
MYLDREPGSDDEEQWLDGMNDKINDQPEIKEAVKVQDPISSLQLSAPLKVEEGTSIRHALDMLQKKQQNCVLVVKDRILSGILTERDMLLKITGKGFDLDLAIVDEFMTANPESLNPENPLAYALNKMHVGGFRHVPIIDDDQIPVGLISISDIISTIADYFSREIINLPPIDQQIDSKNAEGG